MRPLLALACLAIASTGHAQPLVRVRAETRIELAPHRDDDRLAVEGALRDDLGAELVDRTLLIEVRETSPQGLRRGAESVRTEHGGRFRVSFPLPPGQYWVGARFEGEEHLQEHSVWREVLLGREHVRLDVEIDGGPTIDLDVPEHQMTVHARSAAGGGALEITIAENGRSLVTGTTDDAGDLSITLHSSEIGPPSSARLVVRSNADAHRADAQTEVPIVRFRSSTLSLHASSTHVAPGASVRLSGALRTSEGPLSRKAVGLWIGDRHLATALTDDRGEFASTVLFEELGTIDGALVARFEADAPWWGSSASPEVALHVDAPGSIPWAWIAGSIAITAVLFVLAGRRPGAKPRGAAAIPLATRTLEHGHRSRLLADATSISGRVLDARTDAPLANVAIIARRSGASIGETHTNQDGQFALDVPSGSVMLELEARGYEGSRHRVSTPHRGEWSNVVIRLRSLRELAWSPLEPIAARLLPSPDLWSIWTVRDLDQAARARPWGTRSLGSIVESIERACYGPEAPKVEDLEAIRQEAERILREISPQAPKNIAPPNDRGARDR